ncbi:hypothetical protein J6590_104475 [Homalodisca vitripennis]|nr:hypothetical protein J6590_104475 [Homalodisca vitripennis]
MAVIALPQGALQQGNTTNPPATMTVTVTVTRTALTYRQVQRKRKPCKELISISPHPRVFSAHPSGRQAKGCSSLATPLADLTSPPDSPLSARRGALALTLGASLLFTAILRRTTYLPPRCLTTWKILVIQCGMWLPSDVELKFTSVLQAGRDRGRQEVVG